MGKQETFQREGSCQDRRWTLPVVIRALPAGLLILLAGCQSLRGEEGLLPDALRSATAVIRPGDYPDLSKIPDPPKNLPSQKVWADLQSGLQKDGQALEARPGAGPITPSEVDRGWADAARQTLDANPAASEPTVSDAQSEVWAAEARAKMEADLARLPPT